MSTVIRTILHFFANWLFNSMALYACEKWFANMHIYPSPGVPTYLVVMGLGLVLTVLNSLLRPILLMLLAPLNGLTVGFASIVLNALFFVIMDQFMPTFSVNSFWAALGATFIFTILNMVLQMLIPIDDDILYYSLLGQRRAVNNKDGKADGKGIVMLEIDGLSYPRMLQAVEDGHMPFLKDLLQSGKYVAQPYECGIPSQTSSCQSGIMYGRKENICAYRWYEKETRQVLTSSNPQDVSVMEKRLFAEDEAPTGILDNGMSINNIISGNAPDSIFTIAKMGSSNKEQREKRNHEFFMFSLRPYLLTKSLLLTVLDAGREVLTYFKDCITGKTPRLNRLKGFYPFVRGGTNILLRDISTAMIADSIALGKEALYTTLIGYDEIAHHSGPESHEAINALSGIDRSIRKIYEAIQITEARPYEMVVLSDHGQAFGATFLQRYGISLGDYITELAKKASAAEKDPFVISIEEKNDTGANIAPNYFIEVLESLDNDSKLVQQTIDKMETSLAENHTVVIQQAEQEPNDIIVLASGNLVNAYFQDLPHRMTYEEIDSFYPGLIMELVAHPGVGIVGVKTKEGLMILSKDGTRNLDTDEITGSDPLIMYEKPELRAKQLRTLMNYKSVGDLVIISPVYEDGTVAAYEELIGSHGGLGGQQTTPFLFYSKDAAAPREINEVCDVYDFLNEIKNSPVKEVKEESKMGSSFKDMLHQIADVKKWITVLARTLLLQPSAYQEVSHSSSFDGPALLIGLMTIFSTWSVMNHYFGTTGRKLLTNLLLIVLIYGIEILAAYLAVMIFRGKRKAWPLIRTIFFTGCTEFLWLVLLAHHSVSVWIVVILTLRAITLTTSVIYAGELKRRYTLPVFLILIILVPALTAGVLLVYNFVIYIATGQTTFSIEQILGNQ